LSQIKFGRISGSPTLHQPMPPESSRQADHAFGAGFGVKSLFEFGGNAEKFPPAFNHFPE